MRPEKPSTRLPNSSALGYPGGAVIERLARRGNPQAVKLPIPRIDNGKLDFSFSGIKTAVLRYTQKYLSRELAARNWEGEENIPQSVLDLSRQFPAHDHQNPWKDAARSQLRLRAPLHHGLRRCRLQ